MEKHAWRIMGLAVIVTVGYFVSQILSGEMQLSDLISWINVPSVDIGE